MYRTIILCWTLGIKWSTSDEYLRILENSVFISSVSVLIEKRKPSRYTSPLLRPQRFANNKYVDCREWCGSTLKNCLLKLGMSALGWFGKCHGNRVASVQNKNIAAWRYEAKWRYKEEGPCIRPEPLFYSFCSYIAQRKCRRIFLKRCSINCSKLWYFSNLHW
jgi:hypothetical protein